MEKHQMENLCIVGFGAIMHMGNISIISALNSKATVLVPNASSLLVAVSLLALLTQWRPGWIRLVASTRLQQVFLLLLELMIIMGLMELMLVQIWVRMLTVLNILCGYITHALLNVKDEYLVNNTPNFAHWLRSQAFYYARFLLALAIALGILLSQGWQSVIRNYMKPTTRAGASATTEDPTIEKLRMNQITHGVRCMSLDDGQELVEEHNS